MKVRSISSNIRSTETLANKESESNRYKKQADQPELLQCEFCINSGFVVHVRMSQME